MFLKVEKLGKLLIEARRQPFLDFRSLVKNCGFLDVRATGTHSIITGCSCVICMDLTVCHQQIEEKWKQLIIEVAEHEFSRNIEGIDLEDV